MHQALLDVCSFFFSFSFLFRKDPNAFFSFPVTDLIAPGYSLIIRRPMDFSTMKEKVKRECYQSLDELKVSLPRSLFLLNHVCRNMMLSAILWPRNGFFCLCVFSLTDRLQDHVRERHDLQQTRYDLLQGCEEASPLWDEDLEPCEFTCSDTCMFLCSVDTRGQRHTRMQ